MYLGDNMVGIGLRGCHRGGAVWGVFGLDPLPLYYMFTPLYIPPSKYIATLTAIQILQDKIQDVGG